MKTTILTVVATVTTAALGVAFWGVIAHYSFDVTPWWFLGLAVIGTGRATLKAGVEMVRVCDRLIVD